MQLIFGNILRREANLKQLKAKTPREGRSHSMTWKTRLFTTLVTILMNNLTLYSQDLSILMYYTASHTFHITLVLRNNLFQLDNRSYSFYSHSAHHPSVWQRSNDMMRNYILVNAIFEDELQVSESVFFAPEVQIIVGSTASANNQHDQRSRENP